MVDVDGYTWQARLYDRVLEPMNAPLRAVASRLVTLRPNAVVLDIGCGTGAALADYQRAGYRVLGADQSPSMLSQAHVRLGDQADLRPVTGSAVPFDDGCADLILLSLVLHSVSADDASDLLDEARRLLAADGHVLITDFGVEHLRLPRGWGMRAVTALAELAAGPAHARHAVEFLRRGGTAGLLNHTWRTVQQKHTAGGNITITVLSPVWPSGPAEGGLPGETALPDTFA